MVTKQKLVDVSKSHPAYDTISIYLDACQEASRYAEEQMKKNDRERSIRAVSAVLAMTVMAVELLERRKRKGDEIAANTLTNLKPCVPQYQLTLNRLRRGHIELALKGTHGRD